MWFDRNKNPTENSIPAIASNKACTVPRPSEKKGEIVAAVNHAAETVLKKPAKFLSCSRLLMLIITISLYH